MFTLVTPLNTKQEGVLSCLFANSSRNSSLIYEVLGICCEACSCWFCKVRRVAFYVLRLSLKCLSFYMLIWETCVMMNCSPRPLLKNLAFANNLRLDSELKGACVHYVLPSTNLYRVNLWDSWLAGGFLCHRMSEGVGKMSFSKRLLKSEG